MPTLENLLTPVSKVNFTCASLNLMAEYSPRRASAVGAGQLRRSQGVQDGLSYSSTSTATRCPLRSCRVSSRWPKRSGPAGYGVPTPARRSMASSCAPRFRSRWPDSVKFRPLKSSRNDGMAHRPVPTLVDVQSLEQRLVALEQLLQGVHEQALAETPRTGQEVVLAFVHQTAGVGRLVDVVAASSRIVRKVWIPMGSLRFVMGAPWPRPHARSKSAIHAAYPCPTIHKPYIIQTTTPRTSRPASASFRLALAVPALLRAFTTTALLATAALLAAPVHHHQMPFLRSAPRHVPQRLLHSTLDHAGEALAVRVPQHFTLHHESLPQVRRLSRLGAATAPAGPSAHAPTRTPARCDRHCSPPVAGTTAR